MAKRKYFPLKSLAPSFPEPPNDAKEKIDALIDGAQELFAEAFECKHSYSEPCGSCMNTGISAMDKDEFDFAVAVHDLAAIGRRYRNDAILPSSSAPTPETENRCACGRLDLGKYDGLGSTDPKDVSRGSHSRSQCYDMQQRRLPSSSAPKEHNE